jgi:hypothetical protein
MRQDKIEWDPGSQPKQDLGRDDSFFGLYKMPDNSAIGCLSCTVGI